MNRFSHFRRFATLLPVLIAIGACDSAPTRPSAVAPGALGSDASRFAVNGVAEIAEFEVCKRYVGTPGPAVPISYTVDYDANGSIEISNTTAPLGHNQCAVVHIYDESNSNGGNQIQRVRVTEQVPNGYTPSFQTTVITLPGGSTQGPVTAGNSTSGDMKSNAPDNGFLVVFTNTPIPVSLLDGRFTGGASVRVGDVRFGGGLTIHCDRLLSNNFEVNWEGNQFHMTDHVTTVECSDDPNIDQKPPIAPLDTLIGTGTGRFNGVDGYTIHFTLVDAGEPGTDDKIRILIFQTSNPANVVLNLPLQKLSNGNLQAHFDQPHK